jgi:Flp pilus assembly pilin Flp
VTYSSTPRKILTLRSDKCGAALVEISLLIVLIALIGAPSISHFGSSMFHSLNRSTCATLGHRGSGIDIDEVYAEESGRCFTDSNAREANELWSTFF